MNLKCLGECHFLHDNKACCEKPIAVKFGLEPDDKFIEYEFKGKRLKNETEVFKTKEDLIFSL